MMFSLYIAEPNPEHHVVWREVFAQSKNVEILDCDIRALLSLPGLDAALMLGALIHERFGGVMKLGESQIVSSHGKAGMPHWFVTTAPFEASIRWRQDGETSSGVEIVQKEAVSPAEETYIVFTKAFKRISEFNRDNPNPIMSLGFEPEALNLRDDFQKEVQAVYSAYIEAEICKTV